MYKIPLKLNPTNLLPLAWLLLLGSVWGSTIIITKHIVSTGHEPLGLIFWQLAFGALLLSIMARVQGTSLPTSWVHLRFFFVTLTEISHFLAVL